MIPTQAAMELIGKAVYETPALSSNCWSSAALRGQTYRNMTFEEGAYVVHTLQLR
jgi:hypothetical protein